jgi:DNA-binding NtrC family response regulator
MNRIKGSVLVVDDEPNVRLVFRTALEAAGYAVAEAEDGETAIDRLGVLPADIVLLDLQMPGMGGMEVLRQLRDAHDQVPVVIVTAHGSIPDAVEAMKLGAIDFLSKPLRPEPLRKVVAEVIQRQTPTGPEPITTRSSHPAVATVSAPVIDLTAAKRALNHREFNRAVELLEEALELDPDSAEAHTLMGVLRESLGQSHAAYRAYKAALLADPQYGPARDNLRRYCERFGLDFGNKAINPGAN